MSIPLISPTTPPIARLMSKANGSGVPLLICIAKKMPINPTTDPTDRSIPPVKITSEAPIASIALILAWLTIFIRLGTFRKFFPSNLQIIVKIAKIAIIPRKIIQSDKLICLFFISNLLGKF